MSLRDAGASDVDFLAELYGDEDVRPFLAGGGRYDRDSLLAELEGFEHEPEKGALVVIEVDGERAGAMQMAARE